MTPGKIISNIIHDNLVYPLIFQGWIEDILIDPEGSYEFKSLNQNMSSQNILRTFTTC